jgi:L-seryl-tRNA(Ser) seleniumtransferase
LGEYGGPCQGIGRPAKVGKEELAGLLAAVEAAVAKDKVAEATRFGHFVDEWQHAFSDLPG